MTPLKYKNVKVLLPEIHGGKKWFPVEGWTNQDISRRVIIEYFETIHEAECFVGSKEDKK